MAQQADGTVYIDTLLDTTGFKAGGKDVEAAVRRMSKTVSGIGATAKIALQKQTDAFIKANQAYAQQEKKVESLRNKLKELSEQRVETDEFKEIGKQIEDDTAKLNRLEKMQEEFLAVGGKESSVAYRRRQMQIEELRNSIRYAKGEQEDLLNTGGAYKPVDTSGVEQKLFAEQQRMQQMNNSLSTSYASLKGKVDSYSGSVVNLASIKKRLEVAMSSFLSTIKRVASALGGAMLSGIKKLGSAMFGLNKSTNSANRSFGSSLKTMLKYSLGIRSLYTLFNRLRSTIKDSLSTLAQYSSETKANISSMSSELNRLKGSLATAFEPVLNTIAPIITKLIEMLADAITAIGMFFAALSGRGTYMRAVAGAASTISGTGTAISTIGAAAKNSAVQIGTLASTTERAASATQKTASATKDAAKETKKAKKENDDYLSGLDEIRRWESKDDGSGGDGGGGGGGGGAGGGGISFVEDSIPELFTGIADKLKGIFSDIFDVFKKAWDNKGQGVIDSAKKAFEALKDAIAAVGKTWLEVWTNGTGQAYVESLLNLLRSFLDVIASIATAFTEAWNSGAGFDLITAMYEALTNINNLLADIGDSFVRVFSNGIGVEIWKNILQIATNVWKIIGNIADRLKTAWNRLSVGDRIWTGILKSVNSILTFIKDITGATAEWAAKLNFYPLLDAIAKLMASISPLLDTIGNVLKNIYVNYILPTAKYLLEEALPAIITKLSEFFNFLSQHEEVIVAIGKALLIAFAAGEIVSKIAQISLAIAKLITFFSGSGGLAAGASGAAAGIGMLALKIGGIVSIIASVIAAGVLLIANWDKFVEAAGKLKDWVVSKWEDIKFEISKAWDAIKTKTSSVWNSIKTTLSTVWSGIKTNAVAVFNGIKTSISTAWDNLKTKTTNIWNDIKTTITKTWNNLKTSAASVFGNIKTAITNTWESVKTKTSSVWNGIKNAVTTIWNNLKSTATSKFNEIKSTITTAWNNVKSLTSTAWSKIKSVFSQKTANMLSIAKTVGANIKSAFETAFNGIHSAASSILGKVGSLLSSVWDRVKSTASSVSSAIGNMVSGRGISLGYSYPVTPSPASVSALPPIPTTRIPYLATGAVIPPNAPFLAVLGDQKRGTNIEAPLSSIEQAVTNALKKNDRSAQNVTIRIPVILDSRQVFESVITEAKLKQMISGRNPFEMA